MTPAWIALGSNLADPRTRVLRALRWLAALPHTSLEARSSLHRTAPVGPPQPDFVNAVARVSTALAPHALLAALQQLERAAGRERNVHWGPRTLDLDLLMMGARGALRVATPALALPHPRMHERRFVLAPLAEIDRDLTLPGGLTVALALRRCARGA